MLQGLKHILITLDDFAHCRVVFLYKNRANCYAPRQSNMIGSYKKEKPPQAQGTVLSELKAG